MKNCLKLILTPLFLISLTGIINAHSVTPLKQEITLGQGERTTSTLTFTNESEQEVELKLDLYSYNPKTDSIYDKPQDIFLKADTDTTIVQPNKTVRIQYEIYPLTNLEKGTYFNIIALTPVSTQSNITLTESISQLIILHIVDTQDQINNVTTDQYSVNIEVEDKGIPLLQPMKIKYTITNNSNYVISPDGNIEIYNTKGKYKSYTKSINPTSQKLYPKDTLEETVELKGFHIPDLFYNRTVVGRIYNGLDNQPKIVDTTMNSYRAEMLIGLLILITGVILIRSIREDND